MIPARDHPPAMLPEADPAPAGPGLTDLALRGPGQRRWVHALAHQAPLRFAGRVLAVGAEVARARVADAARGGGAGVVRCSPGRAGSLGRRVALYAHYSQAGAISPMVLHQLALYRAAGFDVVFASNAPCIDGPSWDAAGQHCAHLLQRRNMGYDFGAWQDAARLLDPAAPPDELLLVNDSVLGPFSDLAAVFARAGAAGPGAVGLTESHQGGVHLQSYFVLLRGAEAVLDALHFLARLRLSSGKWLMVQRGEFGLSRHLLRRGHRVAALFGYAASLDAILAHPVERRYLMGLVRGPRPLQEGALRDLLLRWPLNPTHHLWRGLPACLGFPFLKTAVLSRNPGRLPGLEAWPAVMQGPPAALDAARGHLAALPQARH